MEEATLPPEKYYAAWDVRTRTRRPIRGGRPEAHADHLACLRCADRVSSVSGRSSAAECGGRSRAVLRAIAVIEHDPFVPVLGELVRDQRAGDSGYGPGDRPVPASRSGTQQRLLPVDSRNTDAKRAPVSLSNSLHTGNLRAMCRNDGWQRVPSRNVPVTSRGPAGEDCKLPPTIRPRRESSAHGADPRGRRRGCFSRRALA